LTVSGQVYAKVEQSTYTFKVSTKSKQMNYEVLYINIYTYIYIFGQISTYLLTRYFINKTISSHVTAHNNIYFNVVREPTVLKTAHQVLLGCIYLRI